MRDSGGRGGIAALVSIRFWAGENYLYRFFAPGIAQWWFYALGCGVVMALFASDSRAPCCEENKTRQNLEGTRAALVCV